MTDKQTNGAVVLDKALTLFERVASDRGKTPISELLHDMALPASTRHRLLGVLERRGFISRVGHGRYDLGISLAAKIIDMSPTSRLARIARPLLDRLAEEMQTTVHLGIWENEMVTYLVKATGGPGVPAAAFTRESMQLEAYCSGLGKILLAHLPAPQLQTYLAAGPFIALTPRTITDSAKLAAALKRVRTTQFAIDDGEVADDLSCIAVPVRNKREEVIAALSLSFRREPAQTKRIRNLLPRMNDCAGRIRAMLGGDAY